jgi:cyclic di-GMP phosphodiesterase
MTHKILIVDDEMANLRLLERMFRHDHRCLTASSGAEAIQLLQQHEVAVLITDQRMPQMTGIELLKHTAEMRPHMVRILLTGYTDVEALVEAINSRLVYMYVTKPWKNEDIKLRVDRAIEHYENNKKSHALALANERLTAQVKEMKVGFVRALAEALSRKDESIYQHATRVSKYASIIGERIELEKDLQEDLTIAAFLHDIGKIGTPERILTGLAAGEDLTVLRAHPEEGANILGSVSELHDVADAVRFHHENFDGTGYPLGLIGDQIPIISRIIRVADEYDLLTMPRNSSEAVSHHQAVATLSNRVGKDFDRNVVQVLVDLHPDELRDLPDIAKSRMAPEASDIRVRP